MGVSHRAISVGVILCLYFVCNCEPCQSCYCGFSGKSEHKHISRLSRSNAAKGRFTWLVVVKFHQVPSTSSQLLAASRGAFLDLLGGCAPDAAQRFAKTDPKQLLKSLATEKLLGRLQHGQGMARIYFLVANIYCKDFFERRNVFHATWICAGAVASQ